MRLLRLYHERESERYMVFLMAMIDRCAHKALCLFLVLFQNFIMEGNTGLRELPVFIEESNEVVTLILTQEDAARASQGKHF